MKKRFIGKFITTCAGLVVMGMLLGNGFFNVRVYADGGNPDSNVEYDIELNNDSIGDNYNSEGDKGDFDIVIDKDNDPVNDTTFSDVIKTQAQPDSLDVPNNPEMKAPEESTVYIECKPSEGYQVEKVDVTGIEKGETVQVFKGTEENHYSFTMPGFDIYVSVIFKQKQDPIPTPTPTPTLTPISETIETEVLQESSMLSRLSKGADLYYTAILNNTWEMVIWLEKRRSIPSYTRPLRGFGLTPPSST